MPKQTMQTQIQWQKQLIKFYTVSHKAVLDTNTGNEMDVFKF